MGGVIPLKLVLWRLNGRYNFFLFTSIKLLLTSKKSPPLRHSLEDFNNLIAILGHSITLVPIIKVLKPNSNWLIFLFDPMTDLSKKILLLLLFLGGGDCMQKMLHAPQCPIVQLVSRNIIFPTPSHLLWQTSWPQSITRSMMSWRDTQGWHHTVTLWQQMNWKCVCLYVHVVNNSWTSYWQHFHQKWFLGFLDLSCPLMEDPRWTQPKGSIQGKFWTQLFNHHRASIQGSIICLCWRQLFPQCTCALLKFYINKLAVPNHLFNPGAHIPWFIT